MGFLPKYIVIFKDFIYPFVRHTHTHTEREREREREVGRDIGRGRSRLHAGSPTQDLVPGL